MYDFAVDKRNRRITLTITPVAFAAEGTTGFRPMAAGAAAEYILKCRTFGAIYGLEQYEVCLVPRTLGYPGCHELMELGSESKHSMRDCFLATARGCAQVLNLEADWLSSVWLTIA